MKGPPSNPNTPLITIEMVDLDVISRVAVFFETSVRRVNARRSKWNVTYKAQLTGKRAVALMSRLKPHMSLRRQMQIERAIASYDPLFGSKSRVSKVLTPAAICAIRARYATGDSLRKIARDYGVNHETIRDRLQKGF